MLCEFLDGRPDAVHDAYAARARSTAIAISCAPRGTCAAHPRSRKYRRSSPTIVGTANDENATPRSRVEAIDRLHQAKVGDLHQVIERLARAGIPARELPRERHEPLDQLLSV